LLSARRDAPGLSELSARELEVLALLTAGLTNDAIADRLGVNAPRRVIPLLADTGK
jgi:DNA-binding CsgD family transcriptional regulator